MFEPSRTPNAPAPPSNPCRVDSPSRGSDAGLGNADIRLYLRVIRRSVFPTPAWRPQYQALGVSAAISERESSGGRLEPPRHAATHVDERLAVAHGAPRHVADEQRVVVE